MNVNEKYQILLEYQEILTEKFKLLEKKEELPKIISSRIEILNKLKKKYLNNYNQFKKLEESIIENQRKMNEIAMQKKSIEEKTKIIKSTREYDALGKELEYSQKQEDEYKFQLLQDQKIIEDLRNNLEKDKISIKQQEDDIAKEQERVNNELSKIEEELNLLKQKEDKIISEIDENIRYKFERIVKNKEGQGIVTISKGHCNGCYIILPAEFINNVRKGDNIYFCPNCSRILYFTGTEEDPFRFEEEGEEEDFFELEE